MPTYDKEEVRGILVADQVFCTNCISEGPKDENTFVLTETETIEGGTIYVCDNCMKKL